MRADPPVQARWRTARYRASKLGLSSTSEVQVERRRNATEEAALLASGPGTPRLALGSETLKLTVTSSFLGRDVTNRVWLDPATGNALQRIHVETGARPRWKSHRYSDEGVLTVERRPRGRTDRSPAPEGWRETSRTFTVCPTGVGEVTEPAALLLLVGDPGLERPGASREVVVFSRHRFSRVTLAVRDQVTVEMEYRLLGGVVRGSRSSIEARRLSVRSRPTVADEPGKLELLGLQGDLEVLVDRELGVPILLRGRIRALGALEVRLVALEAAPRDSDGRDGGS